ELDPAGLDRGRVVSMNHDERIHLAEVRGAVRSERTLGGLRGLRTDTGAEDAEADEHRAAALQERLARELLLMQKTRHGYLPPFAITPAACLIAVRMRG